jgi:hypothetical protein
VPKAWEDVTRAASEHRTLGCQENVEDLLSGRRFEGFVHGAEHLGMRGVLKPGGDIRLAPPVKASWRPSLHQDHSPGWTSDILTA